MTWNSSVIFFSPVPTYDIGGLGHPVAQLCHLRREGDTRLLGRGEQEVGGNYREVEMAHDAVVLGVKDLFVECVEVAEPVQAVNNVEHVAVLEGDVEVVLKHA